MNMVTLNDPGQRQLRRPGANLSKLVNRFGTSILYIGTKNLIKIRNYLYILVYEHK